MSFRFKLRRGTAAAWTARNSILLDGEPGYEKDTGKLKIGDGTTAWNDLEYFDDNDSAAVLVTPVYLTDDDETIIPVSGRLDITTDGSVSTINLVDGITIGQQVDIRGNGYNAIRVEFEIGSHVDIPIGAWYRFVWTGEEWVNISLSSNGEIVSGYVIGGDSSDGSDFGNSSLPLGWSLINGPDGLNADVWDLVAPSDLEDWVIVFQVYTDTDMYGASDIVILSRSENVIRVKTHGAPEDGNVIFSWGFIAIPRSV